MANAVANYKIKVEGNTLSVGGVKKVESVTDRQAVLITESKLVVCGNQLSVSKLDLDSGSILLTFDGLQSIAFGTDKGKFSLKGLLK